VKVAYLCKNETKMKKNNSDFSLFWAVGVGFGITSVGKERNVRTLGRTFSYKLCFIQFTVSSGRSDLIGRFRAMNKLFMGMLPHSKS
jgi:hypothetical protein